MEDWNDGILDQKDIHNSTIPLFHYSRFMATFLLEDVQSFFKVHLQIS
jgi:hypothetical protein